MEILIIKLGAMGDVLRTTPLLTALKIKYPSCRLTWLVDQESAEVLRGNPLIDTLAVFSEPELARLKKRPFDLAVNLDKEPEALEAISVVSARDKKGFGRAADGSLCALDPASEYAYRLGVEDELKFRVNEKSYQQISFEQLGLSFREEEYLLPIAAQDTAFAKNHLRKIGASEDFLGGRFLIGLNTSSGRRFAGKKLPLDTYLDMIRGFHEEMDAATLLLGGPDEAERNREIERRSEARAFNAGSHSIKRFAAIVKECDLVVSGDTLAMHVAIAMKTPVVAFFGSTCAAEIHLYGRGRKIASGLYCSPCYLHDCPIGEQCMKDMSAEVILQASKEILEDVIIRHPEESALADDEGSHPVARDSSPRQMAGLRMTDERSTKIIFLDRDGVINEFPGMGNYVTGWEKFRFLPDALGAIALLTREGYEIHIVSNQGCVARGLLTMADLQEITRRMLKEIEKKGGSVSGVHYCIHQTSDGCECKKPKTALFRQALRGKPVDLSSVYFIGDSEEDIEASHNLGCQSVLVLSGRVAEESLRSLKWEPDAVKKNLWDAVQWIIQKNQL